MKENQNINTMYKNTLDNENLQKQIEKSTEFYAPQPFVKENYFLFRLSKTFHFIFSIFSIITGFGFLYFLFVDYLWIGISGALASVLLFGLEIVKSVSLEMSIKRLYQRRVSGLGLFGLACVCVSVLFSVLGAKELFEHLDKSVHTQKNNAQKEIKTIAQEYDKKIAQEKQELKQFKESVSWQGKININDENVSKNINGYLARVDSLISQKNKTLQRTTTQNDKENQILLQDSNFNLWAWLSVSLSNEFLLLLCVWYACHYHWHTQKERAILTDTNTYKTTAQDLQNIIGLYFNNGQNNEFLSIEAGHKVGFSVGKSENKSEEKSEKKADFEAAVKTSDVNTLDVVHIKTALRTCKHCGTEYVYKQIKQIYCSEKCRIEAWENRTGKKLNFKK